MKTISRHFTTTASIYRMVEWTDGSGNYSQEESLVGTSSGNLQQVDAESAEKMGLRFGLTYQWRCARADDIKLGDKVVIDSKNYGVKGIINHTMGFNDHKEVILEYNE
jgi:hypothetical protein